MPTYKVTDPDTGRTLKLTGDSPPTEEELNQIFGQVSGQQTQPTPEQPKQGVMNKLLEAGVFGPLFMPQTGKMLGAAYAAPQRLVANAVQAIESDITGQPRQSFSIPVPEYFGGPIQINPPQSIPEILGPAVQTAAMSIVPNTTAAGAMFGAGQAMTERKGALETGAMGVAGGVLGQLLSSFVGQPTVTRKITDKVINAIKRPTKQLQLKQTAWAKQDVKTEANKAVQSLKETDTAIKSTVEKDIQATSQNLDKVIPQRTIKVQKEIPDYIRASGDTYGKNLGKISDDLGNSIDYFSRENANQILQKTISELDEIGITEGPARVAIDNLAKKYNINWNAFPSDKTMISANKPVPFKDFILEVRNITNNLSRMAKSGQRFAPEDISVAILQKNQGEFVATKVPEFKQLQQEYAPVVQSLKELGKLFKPYAGKFTNINGANTLLRKYAFGKATPQEIELIKSLEKGSNFAKGIGDFSSDIRNMGLKIQQGKEALKYEDSYIKQATSQIKSSIQPKLEKLTSQQRALETSMANKAKVENIRNALLWVGAGLTGISLIQRLINLQSSTEK